jgi:hypothetical protein
MENEEFILGYQWSPEDKHFMGEYLFPNNRDKKEIHLPPNTTLIEPPICPKGYELFWDGEDWYIEKKVIEHPPIKNYLEIIPEYIDKLKDEGAWTAYDEVEYQKALIKNEEEQIRWENSRDYMQELRSIRDQLLYLSDWTQLNDVQTKLSDQQKQDWDNYRQTLRDLPQNIDNPKEMVSDPNHPNWPINPNI